MVSRIGRVAVVAVAPAALLLPGGDALARGPVAGPPPSAFRTDEFAGWWHDEGQLLLHVSNRGRFGRSGADATAPSAEWPAGSNHEYLCAAGLWVGGVVGSDTLVTAGLYQFGEFYNHETEGCGEPPVGICVTQEGAPDGRRLFDDDGDGAIDEDPLDGADNDTDGRVDEDFAAISQQMYRTAFYDSSTFFNQFFPDSADHHHPLGLAVTQESYVWTQPELDDFVGVELRIRNDSRAIDGVGWDIDNVYLGMLVDSDVGYDDLDLNPWEDDMGAYAQVDTTVLGGPGAPYDVSLRMGYMYDTPGLNGDDVPGYLGWMLLGHGSGSRSTAAASSRTRSPVEIHAFRIWSSGDDDPRDDLDRYHLMRGVSDQVQTIDPPTTRADDWRYLVSAGPFESLAPDAAVVLQLAFVSGEMVEITDENGVTRLIPDLTNPIQAQRVFDGYWDSGSGDVVHWAGNHPPAVPNVRMTPGNGTVLVEWDEFPEGVPDPITGELDFAGYRLERAGPMPDHSLPPEEAWRLIAEWDTSEVAVIDTGNPGIGRYAWTDHGLRNFQSYWYRVGAWDRDELSSPGSPVRVVPRATSVSVPEAVRVQPNPWRASTDHGSSVRFLGVPPEATTRIYGIDGRLVATLAPREVEWTPTVNGIYFWRVSTPDGRVSGGKLVVLR